MSWASVAQSCLCPPSLTLVPLPLAFPRDAPQLQLVDATGALDESTLQPDPGYLCDPRAFSRVLSGNGSSARFVVGRHSPGPGVDDLYRAEVPLRADLVAGSLCGLCVHCLDGAADVWAARMNGLDSVPAEAGPHGNQHNCVYANGSGEEEAARPAVLQRAGARRAGFPAGLLRAAEVAGEAGNERRASGPLPFNPHRPPTRTYSKAQELY